MLTVFSDQIDLDAPRSEYPRPQLVRDSFFSLNGSWEFAGMPKGSKPGEFTSEITVPYIPECELSGIGLKCPRGYSLWYRRRFSLPGDFCRDAVLLHFERIAGSAKVWVNGVLLQSYANGREFSADITAALQPENEILVCVEKKETVFAAPVVDSNSFGIESDVWCESVPAHSIRGLRMVPHAEIKRLELTVIPADGEDAEKPCFVTLAGRQYEIRAGIPYYIETGDAALWTVQSPALHEVEILFGEDRVKSYFALRDFSDGTLAGHGCFSLNGKSVFLNGVNYAPLWPDSYRTVPSEAALVNDLDKIAEMGFNALRLPFVVEDDRFYYHCDQKGLMVVQMLPSKEDDRLEAVLRLLNHPCIVMWELDGKKIKKKGLSSEADRILAEDAGRLIFVSGSKKYFYGNVRSVPLKGKKSLPEQDDSEVMLLTEAGSLGCIAFGHAENEHARAKKLLDSPQLYQSELEELYTETLPDARQKGLAGCFYTQFADNAVRCDGLMSFDRQVCKIHIRDIRKSIDRLNNGSN